MRAAVIGAGMAGVTMARQLVAQGNAVTLFDKSKGTGGRMSSRSWQGGWIDHGAPYFAARSDEFAGYLQRHLAPEVWRSWQAQISGTPNQDELADYIGIPRNSSITRSLLGAINFQPSTRIAGLEREGNSWLLFNDGESLLGRWDLVVITAPAPQTYVLVRDFHEIAEQVKKAQMEPCWVAAVQLSEPLNETAEVMIDPVAGLRRIVANSAKPGRNNKNVYLLQATADWSQGHLEETPEMVGAKLCELLLQGLCPATPPQLLFAHRWRYAFTKTPLGKGFLWSQGLQLGICGDWCIGRTVEDAWASAMALAEQISN
ncbi:NAD(P)/FAD-dependent oxidoreductase [Pelovirga terrestris]|uniref:FAD-dependent oxidoreductase n=1 Tax=Pelovirga terrestris TaxID=2771352 RepID=A0A8J6QMA9_9BACT|nr:FAD-dependent oxidoreductase [Pelovirga terrestris]MBD1399937.1 FAD-dependent oxidoreductase [Pelovirga terrestris]